MRKAVLTIIVLIIFISGYQQADGFSGKNGILFSIKVNQITVKRIVKKIAKLNVYVVTPENSKIVSEQESNYIDLLKTASIEELTQLAVGDKRAVVRLYAFRALMESVKDAPEYIFLQFMNDTTPIKVVDGTRAETKPLNSISNGFLY